MKEEFQETFGDYFESALLAEILDVGNFVELPEGEIVMDIGLTIDYMPLLLSGVIKILREDEEGDELLLYYLEQGETCSTTMACCMEGSKSEIAAVTETPVRMIMVPSQKMEEWMSKYLGWRKFILDSYHNRLNELLQTVDNIAFKNLDERLVRYLTKKAKIANGTCIRNTHYEIATDLHTSRVVISRLLKKLEKMGKLKLSRNHIKIIDL